MKAWAYVRAVGVVLGTLAMASPVCAAASKARAVAHLVGRDGHPVGLANFIATSHGVLIELDL